MKTTLKLAFLLVLLIIAQSNSQSWNEMMDSCNVYQQAGDFESALKWALQAEEKAKAEFGELDTNYISSVGAISDIWYYLGNLDSAIIFADIRFNLCRKFFKTDHPYLAQSINNKAMFYNDRGDFDKAEPLYIEALEMTRRIFKTDHPHLAQSINNMAYFYGGKGDFAKAEPLFIEALEMRRRIFKTDHPHLARSINNMGVFYDESGEFAKAETLYIEALEMRRRIFKTDHPDLATSINNMAMFYNDRGDFTKAEPLYIEALEMIRRIYKTDHPDLANSINNMAYFYHGRGDYVKTEPLYVEALEMYRRIFKTDHPNLATSINSMAMFYNGRGDFDKAEPLLIEALEMRRRIFKTEHPDLANSINNMALFYNDRGDFVKAELLYIEALEMRKRIFKTDHPDIARSINNMAAFYHDSGNFAKAELLYNEALEMYRRIFKTDHPDLAASINNMASFYRDSGDFAKAEPLYIEALEMRRRITKTDHLHLALSINNMASFYEGRGDCGKAEPFYREALEMYKNIFNKQSITLSESEKEKFWNTMKLNFERFNSFSMKRYNDNISIALENYDNLLFTKGILLSSTNKMKYGILSSGDSAAITLYVRWSDMRRFNSKNSSLTVKELEKKHINLDSLDKAANDLEKSLSLKSSTFASEMQKKKITWQDVQSELKKGEAAVEVVRFMYHDGKRRTDTVHYAALILIPSEGSNPIDFVLLENGNDLEQLHIKNYKNHIKNKIQDNDSYGRFWVKIAEKLKGVKKVFVSPDGVYNQINLATLYNPKTKKYLLDEMDVQVVTSTRDLVVNKEQKKVEYNNTATLVGNPRFNLDKTEYKKAVASLGNKFKSDYFIDEGTEVTMRSGLHPLPGTGIEVDKISRLLTDNNWKVEKFTDNNAIEEAVKKVNNPRVLHIATHGKFLSDVERHYSNFETETDKQRFVENPLLRSFLVFAGADSPDSTRNKTELDDGFLTAYEAQNLYLDNTELVVLSACETGLGEIKNGEGVYGLQRAFIQAGAKTIIMSLWTVSDEATQELMTSFYKEWLGGKTKREAFHTAQMKLKEKYAYPYYWGAFVMVGE